MKLLKYKAFDKIDNPIKVIDFIEQLKKYGNCNINQNTCQVIILWNLRTINRTQIAL